MPSNSVLIGPTRTLVLIATIILQLVLFDRQGAMIHAWIHLAILAIAILILIASLQFSSTQVRRNISFFCLAVIVGIPFALDAYGRRWGAFGGPFETQSVLVLRNLMIYQALMGKDKRSLAFATLASCFIAMFSLLWLMNSWTISLLIVYAIVGMWWLMGAYWERISSSFFTRTERAIPLKPASLAAAIAAGIAMLTIPFVNNQYFTTSIQGFLSSSGGTGTLDEYAFGGVGDGPQMVSAKDNASGFGPIESELFLESEMPSLYDVFNEFYNPPANKKKLRRQKTIPLAPNLMQENHQRLGKNQRSAREFSLTRKQQQKKTSVSDLKSPALLQIAGRVPVHLSMYAYDQWDGQNLSSSETAQARPMFLDKGTAGEKNWVRYQEDSSDQVAEYEEQHEIRVINLKSNRIPSPPNTRAINIEKIHTANFFNTSPDGMLQVQMDFIPQLAVLHVESSRYCKSQMPPLRKSVSTESTAGSEVEKIAEKWIVGIDVGWPQVQAICTQLQQHYILDSEAMVPEQVDDAVEYFLLESKRGPDYLFASSAALLLRSIGYETRVVSGFYADPENYDHRSRITSINKKDAHFWVEVLAAKGNKGTAASALWITAEPTPGYTVLYAPETLWTQILQRAAFTWHAMRNNPLATMAIVLGVLAFWKNKAYLGDLVVTSWWRIHHRWGDARQQITSTIKLLERRARVRGNARSQATSLRKWQLTPNTTHGNQKSKWEEAFLSLADWALYGDGQTVSYSSEQIQELCSTAATYALRPQRKVRHRAYSYYGEEAK